MPTSTVSKKRKSPLTSEQDDKFDSLEGELPVQAIVVFRKMARQQVSSTFRFFFLPYFVLEPHSMSFQTTRTCAAVMASYYFNNVYYGIYLFIHFRGFLLIFFLWFFIFLRVLH